MVLFAKEPYDVAFFRKRALQYKVLSSKEPHTSMAKSPVIYTIPSAKEPYYKASFRKRAL